MCLFACHAWAGQTIPFEYRDGLIWVKVRATSKGGEPLHFVLDSGAGATVLDLKTAQRLGVAMGKAESVRRVGGTATAFRVSGFKATVAEIPVASKPLALDLSDTSELCHRRIDGLLGQDFFLDRIIQIDFKTGCVRVLDRADERQCCANVPLKLKSDAMCVPVSVNGSRPKWVRLDTGCDDGLHWVGGGQPGITRGTLQLGDETMAGVRLVWHSHELFPSEGGLLGNGILSRYVVTIDTPNDRVLLRDVRHSPG